MLDNIAVVGGGGVLSITFPNQISASPARGANCVYRRGSEDRVPTVQPFHLFWRKCLNVTSFSGGGMVANLLTRLTCSETSNLSGGNFGYLQVSNSRAGKVCIIIVTIVMILKMHIFMKVYNAWKSVTL